MCADSTHARMKADPDLFLACPFRGIQRFESWVCILRQCPRCDSTLAMPMAMLVELYPLVEYAPGVN